MAVGARNNKVGGSQGPVTLWPLNQELVVRSDSTIFELPTAITVYDAGTITYQPFGEQANIQITVTAGMLPWEPRCMVRRVMLTGTSATLIYGSW